MIKRGNWLERVDEFGLSEGLGAIFQQMYMTAEEDREKFKSWKDVAKVYGLKQHELTYDKIQHIVVLECHDGSINQVFTLEEADEKFIIHSGGRCGGIFNTDGSAFIEFIRGSYSQVYHIDNSPYDVGTHDEDEWQEFAYGREDEFNRELALHELREYLRSRGVDINMHKVTTKNTIFVTQL